MEDTTKEMVVEIVSAYLSNNQLPVENIPNLIAIAYSGLNAIGAAPAEPIVEEVSWKVTPAQVRKSITDTGLISFVDGKAYKTLKRHLSTHGMTLAEYKEKFGLPKDYPSTAPSYSAARSAMAKAIGLGRKAGEKAPRKAKAPAGPRGRPRKATGAA